MPYFTYILYSEQMDSYYIGYTKNLSQRIEQHIWKHKGFTGKAKDWVVAYFEEYPTKDEAQSRERQLKKWKSRKMIEKLISK